MKEYQLRPRQERLVEKIIEFINIDNKGVATAPCAFGKAIIIAETARRLPEYQIVCIVPSLELVRQNYEKFCIYSDDGSIYSASAKKKELSRVIFGTVGSFKDKFINYCIEANKPILVIVDECNNGVREDGMIGKFYDKLPNAKLIGLTATPFMLLGNQTLIQYEVRNNLFEKSIDIVQVQEMKGIWTPIEYRTSSTPLIDTIMADRISELQNKNLTPEQRQNLISKEISVEEAERFYNNNNLTDKIIAEINKLIKEGIKSIMVFVPCIAQIRDLQAAYPNSGAVYSGMEKDGLNRTKTLQDFIQGTTQVMFNCEVLTIGFDYPQLESIIFARPTNSLVLWYQCNGRLVRGFEGKEKAICVDLAGAMNSFGPIEELEFIELEDRIVLVNKEKQLSGVPNNAPAPSPEEIKKIIMAKPLVPSEFMGDMRINFGTKYNGEWIMESCQRDPKTIGYLRWMIEKSEMNWDKAKYRTRYQFIKGYLKYLDDMAIYQRKLTIYNNAKGTLLNITDNFEVIQEVLKIITKHIEAEIPITTSQIDRYIDRESKKLGIEIKKLENNWGF